MPAFRMFLVAAAGTLLALCAGPLVSAPVGASTITGPPTVAATNWTNTNAAAGSGSNRADRRVLHHIRLLRGGRARRTPVRAEGLSSSSGTASSWTVVPSVNARGDHR